MCQVILNRRLKKNINGFESKPFGWGGWWILPISKNDMWMVFWHRGFKRSEEHPSMSAMLKHFKRRVDHSSKTTPLEHLKHHDIPAWPSRSQARGWRNLAWRRWRFTPWRRVLVHLKIIIALRIPPQIQRREVIDVVVWQCWRVLQRCPIEGESLRANAKSNQTFNLHLDEVDLVTWLDAHEELWETSSWRLDDDMHFATDLALALALALTRRRARALACQALRMDIHFKLIVNWLWFFVGSC